jgi:hypothetical protein
MRNSLLAASLVCALAACSSEPEAQNTNMSAEEVAEKLKDMKIEPGQWEATNEIISATAPGVPAQQSNNCTYQAWDMNNGKMTGTMTCEGAGMPGKVIMKMSGDYGPKAYDLNMDMNTTGLPGGMTMNIKAKTTGRRVGECTRT